VEVWRCAGVHVAHDLLKPADTYIYMYLICNM